MGTVVEPFSRCLSWAGLFAISGFILQGRVYKSAVISASNVVLGVCYKWGGGS